MNEGRLLREEEQGLLQEVQFALNSFQIASDSMSRFACCMTRRYGYARITKSSRKLTLDRRMTKVR